MHLLADYFNFLTNPISCLLFKFGLKKEIYAKFKNSNKKYKIINVKELNTIMFRIPLVKPKSVDGFVQFNQELFTFNEVITWQGVNIYNIFSENYDFIEDPFFEFFYYGHYDSANIDYENRTVIDIGSFIGDTALYFANNGAEVWGFEPVKKNYEYAFKLMELNPNIKHKMHFFNFGVSDKPGKLIINSMDSTNDYRNSNDSYDIDILTLDDILIKYKIKPDILKIDCEGCEFNIILNTDLSSFKDIIFEHHSKLVNNDYKLLIDKLKSQGFKITKLTDPNSNFEELGLIHAYK